MNALGFDFMIEHPFGHSNDLVDYLCEEGKARECQERKLCVLCSGRVFEQTAALIGKRYGDGVVFPCCKKSVLLPMIDVGAIFEASWRVPYLSIEA